MSIDAKIGSIAERVAQSLAAFDAIDVIKIQADVEDSHASSAGTISDRSSKFKLWAGNIGAHRTGRSSLDYRLRDSSHLYRQVIRLLDDLITSLNEVHSILSGETLPWNCDAGETDELDEELKDLLVDEHFEFDSEMAQLTREIDDTIANLLRLSVSLRNPAPHDHFMSTEYANAGYSEAYKAHVEAKFPKASQILISRLGQALSKRRQYFNYREAHHAKLASGLFDSEQSEAGAPTTVASSVPAAMRDLKTGIGFGRLDEDEHSDAGYSQTSFATTAPETDRLSIPPLPKRADDEPFECPFCFMIISVTSTRQWKGHVLRDLRPYTCLVEDCPTASREYSRRHEWMNHMLQKHWKSWVCPYRCGFYHATDTSLRDHVSKEHTPVTNMELDAMIARCGQTSSLSASSPADCPLCQDVLVTIRQYQRHVGRHQVELSLFALPRNYADDEDVTEQDEDQGTISSGSEGDLEAISDGMPPHVTSASSEALVAQTHTGTSIHSAISATDLMNYAGEPVRYEGRVERSWEERETSMGEPELEVSLRHREKVAKLLSKPGDYLDSIHESIVSSSKAAATFDRNAETRANSSEADGQTLQQTNAFDEYHYQPDESKWRWNCCGCGFQNLNYNDDKSCVSCAHSRDSNCKVWAVPS
ncbi:hypothetical protein F5Y08DRAFT_304936 [Xylaria arbuscula]|nr:hypothetical protein F5Y08DRAFT_304936 [Xylaria arbuscula]